MKTLKAVLVVAAVLGVAGLALAAGKDKGKGKGERPKMVMGTLVKVDGTNLVVKARQGRDAEAKEITVATDDKTEFVVDCETGKLADLKAEMMVRITPDTGTATKVQAETKGLQGTIVKVEDKNVVIKVKDAEKTVTTDDKTKIFVSGKAATLADLKADMRVNVLPETAGTATKIMASTGRGAGSKDGEKPKDKPKKEKPAE